MKFRANVVVKLKEKVKDSKGEAVSAVLKRIGLEEESKIRLGKFFSLEITAQDKTHAREKLDNITRTVLSNPIIENYEILELEEC